MFLEHPIFRGAFFSKETLEAVVWKEALGALDILSSRNILVFVGGCGMTLSVRRGRRLYRLVEEKEARERSQVRVGTNGPFSMLFLN